MGTSCDKSVSNVIISSLCNNQNELTRLYYDSWSAGKIIDIPVDDMFIYQRQIQGLSDDDRQKLQEFYEKFDLNNKIQLSIKSARLYGSSFLILLTDDNLLVTPIKINSKLINLKNVVLVNKFDVINTVIDKDITSPNYGKPIFYNFLLPTNATIKVHYSRVIQIDGIKLLNYRDSYFNNIGNFGVSELGRCISAINNEATLAQAVNHLCMEASCTVVKIKDLQDSLSGSPDVASLDDTIEAINRLKSIYRTIVMSDDYDISRLKVDFGQIPQIFDKYHTILSASADIPQTRFFGKSPAGFSSGDSEINNYAIKIASMQQKILSPIYKKIDKIAENSLNIDHSIGFKFKPLVEMSPVDQSKVNLQNAQRDQIYMSNSVVTDDEVRTQLYDDEVYTAIDPEQAKIKINTENSNSTTT
jgi:phage-related protein (TIGR01555 family)